MTNLKSIKQLLLASIVTCLPQQGKADGRHIFEISGNERTQTSYIEELAENCMTDRNDFAYDVNAQLESFNQCLLNAKIFSEVKSSFEGNKIKIHVDEKWTLIPAPFYQSSGETKKAGIVFFETNFLGRGMTLAAGATFSNRGDSFFGFFTNPSILGSRYFSSISMRKESSTYDLRENDAITYGLLERSIGGTLSAGYRFPWLNLSGQFSHGERGYRKHKDFFVPENYATNMLGATAEYDRRDYKLYFSEGLFIKARYAEALQRDEAAKKLQSAGLLASWQHQIFADHAIYLQSNSGRTIGGRLTDAERVGSSKGFRGIESKTAWTDSYQTETIEYQIPIKTFDKGTLTWAAFVDRGHLQTRGGLNSKVDYTTPGVGVYFFLSRLALPGLGLEYGINNKYQGSFVNFSLGLSI